jgi:hypothetical protein
MYVQGFRNFVWFSDPEAEGPSSTINAPELHPGQFQSKGVLRELLVEGNLCHLGDVELPAFESRRRPQDHADLRVHQ